MGMAQEPNLTPDGSGTETAVQGASGPKYSGSASGGDPTLQPGQYPVRDYERLMFGVSIPSDTGAPGTQGAQGGAGDPTLQAGQVQERISGEGPPDTTSTGAPGTATSPNAAGGGGAAVTYTLPGSYLDGTYKTVEASDDLSGPMDSTMANDAGYGSGGPQLPGIRGNEPAAGEGRFQPPGGGPGGAPQANSQGGLPGSGEHILRGGRGVRG